MTGRRDWGPATWEAGITTETVAPCLPRADTDHGCSSVHHSLHFKTTMKAVGTFFLSSGTPPPPWSCNFLEMNLLKVSG